MLIRSKKLYTSALFVGLTVAGCGAHEEAALSSDEQGSETQFNAAGASLTERIAGIKQGVDSDASAEHIATVQDYLRTHGYFPNAELAEQYPAWRPLVTEEPEQGVYDDATIDAVAAYQAQMGLPTTGVVDAATLAQFKQERCGFPDGPQHLGEHDKFSLFGSRWGQTHITWKVTNTDEEDITPEAVDAAVAAALAKWSAETSLTFSEATGDTADITITFITHDGPGSVLAYARTPAGGGDVKVDIEETWNPAYLEKVLTHEFGHSLGLAHSSITSTIMYPSVGGISLTPSTDDRVGISSLYDTWSGMPGEARDIAATAGPSGALWVIGSNSVAGGYSIHKWNTATSSWAIANGGGVRIAVAADGVPWIINENKAIYRRTSAAAGTAAWTALPGAANDIGAGADGSVWIIGNIVSSGGHSIHKWNPATSSWDAADGGGVRIAVGPDGVPWIVNNQGNIYRRTSNAAGTGAWVQLPGSASDIGVGEGNYAWIVGTTPKAGGFDISVWNEQAQLGTKAGARNEWITLAAGGATQITVGPGGRAYLVNDINNIFQPTR